jgi:hypothetical protein
LNRSIAVRRKTHHPAIYSGSHDPCAAAKSRTHPSRKPQFLPGGAFGFAPVPKSGKPVKTDVDHYTNGIRTARIDVHRRRRINFVSILDNRRRANIVRRIATAKPARLQHRKDRRADMWKHGQNSSQRLEHPRAHTICASRHYVLRRNTSIATLFPTTQLLTIL